MAPMLVDRSDRMRMTFAGEKAKEALNGLVTNDVTKLVPGVPMRAAALTPKGKVIALLRMVDRGADLLLDTDAAAGPGFLAMIRKFVNPRLARYADVTATTGCIGVYGADAAGFVSRTLGALAEGTLMIPSDDLSPTGVDLIGGRDEVHAIADRLRAAGARDATADEVAAMRIAAGVPAWGVEMNDETLPQEAVLDDLGAVAFDKGCYTGQEVVARIHFRGHVNRLLRWLSSPDRLPLGAKVVDADGKEVGEVRSSAEVPGRGPLAIAMVRREVAPGSVVRVIAEGVEARATVAMIAAPLVRG
jgi:folate-binding protein YgfZ